MKTWLVTPAFCKADLLEDLLTYLKDEPGDFTHVVLNNHYPVNHDQNHDRIERMCSSLSGFKGVLIDSGEDLGLHESINNAAEFLNFDHGDIVIVCDPDDRPSPGFVEAIRTVMQADPSLAVLALNFSVIQHHIKNSGHGMMYTKKFISGLPVLIRQGVEMWTVAGYNWSFIKDAGGMNQPNKYYGGLEIDLYQKWKKRGLQYGYLETCYADYQVIPRDNGRFFDPEYREWKTAHAVQGDKRSFGEWLNER